MSNTNNELAKAVQSALSSTYRSATGKVLRAQQSLGWCEQNIRQAIDRIGVATGTIKDEKLADQVLYKTTGNVETTAQCLRCAADELKSEINRLELARRNLEDAALQMEEADRCRMAAEWATRQDDTVCETFSGS